MNQPEPGEIVTDGKSVNIGAPLVKSTARRPEEQPQDDDKQKEKSKWQ